jgi:hypothetical protein
MNIMDNLKNNFQGAKDNNAKYVGLLIETKGDKNPKVIIDSSEVFDTRLKYYIETYDEQLNHRTKEGIKISGFTYGNSVEDIEIDLIF